MGQRSKTSITAFTYCSVLWTRLARFQIEPLLRQMSAPRWVGRRIDLGVARDRTPNIRAGARSPPWPAPR